MEIMATESTEKHGKK